jgi:hypothetical protein
MASTLTSDAVASGVQARAHLHEHTIVAKYTVAAALVLNDVIQMVKIPAGAKIVDLTLSCTDLDTNGTPAIVLDVGDGSDTDRFIDGSTIGQAGGIARLDQHGGHGYAYSAEDTIDVLVQVAPATGATSGTITLTVKYTMEKVYGF